MTIVLDDYTIETTGRIQLNLVFDVHVMAIQAQQTVNSWLIDDISTQLSSLLPTFVLLTSGVAVWRTPIQLSLIEHGRFPVTTVDVSAETGQIINQDKTYQQILTVLEEEIRPQIDTKPFTPRAIPTHYLNSLNPKPIFMPQ